MAKNITLPFYPGEKVVIAGRDGWVSAVTIAADGRILYFCTTNDANGVPAPAYFMEADITSLAPKTVFAVLDYFKMFTLAEQLALYGSNIPQVRLAVGAMALVTTIDVSDVTVTGQLDGFVALGLLTAARAAKIKAGNAAPPLATRLASSNDSHLQTAGAASLVLTA